ncbi:hypothetical protein CBS101457_003910 [Exobasidium rhododendri]|nr:hypothetical protein CBS101457_003910 [Exobasidium rhododendri]
MVRAPTIRGRPTPARKHKSSSATLASSASSRPSLHTAKTTVPKALKRADKRASLLAKTTGAEGSNGAASLLKKGQSSISKSSLRRRKRKARDEIGRSVEAGTQGGVKELQGAVEDLEMELEVVDGDKSGGKDATSSKESNLMSSARGGKVTTNQRKKVL